MNLSKHFTLEEMERSDYAIRHNIDNTPSPEESLNLQALCIFVLEPLREIIKRPLFVSSGFRCKEVNLGIGGSLRSQHQEGKAADIIAPEMTIDELFDMACKFVPYDQIIHEFGRWVHVSYNGDANRHQQFKAIKKDGKTEYIPLKQKDTQ